MIGIRIGNLSTKETVGVRIRLLDADGLSGMNRIRFEDTSGSKSIETNGAKTMTLTPLESVSYQISSQTLQIGVPVVDTPADPDFENLSSSFFYRLISPSTTTDLIVVGGAGDPHLRSKA